MKSEAVASAPPPPYYYVFSHNKQRFPFFRLQLQTANSESFLIFLSQAITEPHLLACWLEPHCVISHGFKFWSAYNFKYYLHFDDCLPCTSSPNICLDLRPFRLSQSSHSLTLIVSLRWSPSPITSCFFLCWKETPAVDGRRIKWDNVCRNAL